MRVDYVIEEMVEDYYAENGRKPAGIILGPKEYLALCEILKDQKVMRDAKVGSLMVTEYRGYPVYVKEMPGVDIMIPFTEAFKY